MVLQPRYKSEEVWYNIVWEEKEYLSNVVEYNINREVTKDTSAVFNANNDTTTGMANVIPWVNAPKLLAATSIIWWTVWGTSVSYCELWISSTATLPANTYTDFDKYTVNVASNDISLNEDHPTRVYIKKWIYLIYLFIRVWSSTITFTWSMQYYHWWSGTYIMRIIQPEQEQTAQTLMYSFPEDWYIYIWINPSASVSASSLSGSLVRLMKLW